MAKVVFVYGLPGSGKSYFAEKLAEKLNAQYLNSDRLRKELFDVRKYTPQEKKAVYEAMLAALKKAVHNQTNIVLDATFHKEEIRKPFVDFLKNKSTFYFIEITADDEVIRERLKHPRPYSDANYEIHTLIKEKFEPITLPKLVLKSTNENIDEMLAEALKKINEKYER